MAEQVVEVGECSGKEAAAALFEAKVNSRNFLTREQHKLSCLTDPFLGGLLEKDTKPFQMVLRCALATVPDKEENPTVGSDCLEYSRSQKT